MIRRLAAVSALVLGGLAAIPAAQAQAFFSFYETSPREVVDRLYEQGYNVHLPMVRRGDIYVVDAVSSSRRPMRLIVSARDGHVLERYATTPRWSDDQPRFPRWRDDEADRGPYDSDEPRPERRTRTALGETVAPPPRVFDRDNDFDTRPNPPAPLSDDSDKPKHHAKRHAPVAKDVPDFVPKPEPPVAAVAPSDTKPTRVEPSAPAKPIDSPPAKATARTDPKGPEPKPSPAADARLEGMPAPHQAPGSPAKAEDALKPIPTTTQAKTEDKPAPKPTPKPSPSAQARVEEKPKPEVAPNVAPKPEAPRKKLNDLPVGTLD